MFGEILKELRLDKGMTQEDLSLKLNLSRSSISKYETGENEPTLEILILCSNLFNVSIDYLLGRTRNAATYNTLHIIKEHSPETQKKLNYIISKFKSKKYIDMIYSLLRNIENL